MPDFPTRTTPQGDFPSANLTIPDNFGLPWQTF
jgi:hypothetical protein